jgi:hypothetical protein
MFRFVWLPVLLSVSLAPAEQFEPQHRLTALGVARGEMTDELLARREKLMIDAQTFGILRDPRALEGAQRITSPKLQKIFKDAEKRSGLPASLIAAVAYLESWGVSNAQSPTGPRGVMQIAGGTARSMGLRMIYATRYRTATEKRTVKNKKGKTVTKSVRRRMPYSVLVKDERMVPERAIPAAAVYLSRLENKFGGIDWAVFAYHCGEGCVGSMKALTEQARGIKAPYTVSKMFFSATPAFNRELYEAVRREMERDFSPTYYFRIMRAQQLLKLYQADPAEFKSLAAEYRYEPNPSQRAPHRLAVWLRTKDLRYQNAGDINADAENLVPVFDDPDTFGFQLHKEEDQFLRATPAAIGTLTYLTYETRRLFHAIKSKDKWMPLEVISLVHPASEGKLPESAAHASGQVFDIDVRALPLAEREALDFILQDMGWSGYVGFVEEAPGSGTLHIGCSPSAREFFTEVYREAAAHKPSRGLQKELLDRGPGMF